MLASMIFRKEPFFHGHDNYDQVEPSFLIFAYFCCACFPFPSLKTQQDAFQPVHHCSQQRLRNASRDVFATVCSSVRESAEEVLTVLFLVCAAAVGENSQSPGDGRPVRLHRQIQH